MLDFIQDVPNVILILGCCFTKNKLIITVCPTIIICTTPSIFKAKLNRDLSKPNN